MNPIRRAVSIGLLMGGSAAAGIAARPSTKGAGGAPRYLLEDIVPKRFGDWTLQPEQGAQVVNPQTEELLKSLYSQILTRTYVNSRGYRVMLSLAYGDDQRGGLQAHKPEVCYPAQGFKLLDNRADSLGTAFGNIEVRRLNTSMGPRREPITYWINVSDTVITSVLQKRMLEIKLGLTGQIPDGLLFRISSIDDSTSRAFRSQDAFVSDLLQAVPPIDRKRLSGLGAAG